MQSMYVFVCLFVGVDVRGCRVSHECVCVAYHMCVLCITCVCVCVVDHMGVCVSVCVLCITWVCVVYHKGVRKRMIC